MIQLPEEIVHMINIIEAAGYEAYAVGGCVRDSILGRHPEDWDLTSNASRDALEGLFPGAKVINKQLGVMRITQGGITADIAAYRIDGEYKDYRRPESVIFTQEIGEDLRRRDFTMNAIAVSPDRGIVDPYNGRGDIERKLIRGIGEPEIRFEEDALRILRGIRFSAQLGFEIDSETLRAMTEKKELLTYISMERIREEFFKTVTARFSGNGLSLLLETGALTYILGEHYTGNASIGILDKLTQLTDKIDLTDKKFRFRAALIYLCLEKGRAASAIERMGYSNEMKKMLMLAVNHLEEFRRIRDKIEFKKFISKLGTEGYFYLVELLRQQSIAFGLDEKEVKDLIAIYESIQNSSEPVYIRDLALDGNDLKASGISEGREIGNILNSLLDIVHAEPEKNKKMILLELAKEIVGPKGTK